MKDKAAVLLELEKLTTVKEELTDEVARLHKLLEQERSSTKVNNTNSNTDSNNSVIQNSKHKDKVNYKLTILFWLLFDYFSCMLMLSYKD